MMLQLGGLRMALVSGCWAPRVPPDARAGQGPGSGGTGKNRAQRGMTKPWRHARMLTGRRMSRRVGRRVHLHRTRQQLVCF